MAQLKSSSLLCQGMHRSISQEKYQTLVKAVKTPIQVSCTVRIVSLVTRICSATCMTRYYNTLLSSLYVWCIQANMRIISSGSGVSDIFPYFYKPSVDSGQWYIGVGGQDTNATYTIRVDMPVLASSSSVMTYPAVFGLLAGIPQVTLLSLSFAAVISYWKCLQDDVLFANIHDSWKYYHISLPPGHESIQLRSSSFAGQIDIYVSRCGLTSTPAPSSVDGILTWCYSQHHWPNTTVYDYTTSSLESDNILITRNDFVSTDYIIGTCFRTYSINMSVYLS